MRHYLRPTTPDHPGWVSFTPLPTTTNLQTSVYTYIKYIVVYILYMLNNINFYTTIQRLNRLKQVSRLQKTAKDRFCSLLQSRSGFSSSGRFDGPVSVSVLAKKVKKPDWTGLSNTNNESDPNDGKFVSDKSSSESEDGDTEIDTVLFQSILPFFLFFKKKNQINREKIKSGVKSHVQGPL